MYDGDSFFTLSAFGQFGLAVLSIALSVVAIWLMTRLTLHWALRVIAAGFGFWLFVWLTPQIYYLYYLAIIDGLPVQWIIQRAPSPFSILDLLIFRGDNSLSAHSQGLLGWAMIAAAAIRR